MQTKQYRENRKHKARFYGLEYEAHHETRLFVPLGIFNTGRCKARTNPEGGGPAARGAARTASLALQRQLRIFFNKHYFSSYLKVLR